MSQTPRLPIAPRRIALIVPPAWFTFCADELRALAPSRISVMTTQMRLGADFGYTLDEIRAAADRGPRVAAAAIFAAFGITDWTTATEDAVVAALTTPTDGEAGPVATAITVAFTSPEVTLS